MIDDLPANEQKTMRELLAHGTLRESFDPDASGRVRVRGRSYPVNLAVRLCDRPTHEGWELWGEDGRLSCGFCHPPADPERARWVLRGGPITDPPRLDQTPSGRTSIEVFTLSEDEPETEKGPQRRRRRYEPAAGQGSILTR